jgi:hypothetical protein
MVQQEDVKQDSMEAEVGRIELSIEMEISDKSNGLSVC